MIIKLLKETEALLEGHFLLSSGKHSNKYVQCAKLFQYPDKAEEAVEEIVKKLKNIDFDIVVGPAIGGIIVSYEIGRQTNKPAIFTERINGKMTLRRGFKIEKGEKILIGEDVITTGKSSLETIEAIRELGGDVVGVACLVDRSDGNFNYPIFSGTKLKIETYNKEECPLCKKGIVYKKPGSRNNP